MAGIEKSPLIPVAAAATACKVCSTNAPLWGVADFNKNCQAHRGCKLPLAGIPIYYYRCPACALVFTTALDGFAHDDFQRYIYNDEYILVDPEYAESRPISNAKSIANVLERDKSIRVLDYGGGSGKTAELLRTAGFPNVLSYDPFVASASTRPAGKFDVVLCFEVVEHSPRPIDTFRDMSSFMADEGVILFSTLLQPKEIEQIGMNWWYIGPRNGHVTIFSSEALRRVADAVGLRVMSTNRSSHLMFKTIPPFLRHLINPT